MSTDAQSTWLLDLGNSRAKLARLHGGIPADIVALDWLRPDFTDALRTQLDVSPPPQRILVASVASRARADSVRACLPAVPGNHIEWLTSPRRGCGIENRYARPERLGVDRFLSMVAVRERSGSAVVVAGCGTALTLDAVTTRGLNLAGLIVPSPGGMLEILRDDTAIAEANPDAFGASDGDDTAVALRQGCWAAAGALIEWFAGRQRSELGAMDVWLHGGWAEAMAGWLASDGFEVHLMEHAVLHGLAAWAARHCHGVTRQAHGVPG